MEDRPKALARQTAQRIMLNLYEAIRELDGKGGKIAYTVHVAPGAASARIDMTASVHVMAVEEVETS